MDQVGVKAPGRPTMTVFLPLVNSERETILGGPKPSCRLTAGMRSPTLTMALSVARNMNLWLPFWLCPHPDDLADPTMAELPRAANRHTRRTDDDGPTTPYR